MRYSGVIPTNVLRLMPPEERARLGKAGVLPEEALANAEIRLERDLQIRLRALLGLRGIAYQQSRMDKKTTGTVGWPDFTFAVNGRPVAWECKLPGKDLDEDQVRVIEQMKANGWDVRVIRSVEQAMGHLREFDVIGVSEPDERVTGKQHAPAVDSAQGRMTGAGRVKDPHGVTRNEICQTT